MMKKIFFKILLASFILLAGCGKRAYVDYQPNNIPKIKGNTAKILILPFSSYSLCNSPKLWMQANIMLYDSISDNFAMHKILPIPFEDVFSVLNKKGFLNFSSKSSSAISPTLKMEYENSEWSPTMKKEIVKIIYNEIQENNLEKNSIKPILFLTDKSIFNLNKIFNANYIIRGSITELRIQNEETFNPIKIGFINAPLKFLSRALYGVAQSNSWSTGQEVFTGVITGAILGSFANEPFQAPGYKTVNVPLLGTTIKERESGPTDYQWGNAAFWGAMTGFSAYIASHGGAVPEIVVGLRIYFYDAKNKQLLWSNRIKLHVTPDSQWSKQNITDLVNYAIKQSVDKLLSAFWNNNLIEIANK